MTRRSFLGFFVGLVSLIGFKTPASPVYGKQGEWVMYDPLTLDIAANGILCPIVMHNDEVVDGHRRLAAAKTLGIKNIPYTYI